MAKIVTKPDDELQDPDDRPTRVRLIQVVEKWVRECDEFPGCKAASPDKPCCGEGHWERIAEE